MAIFILILVVLLNGLLAMAEIALVSARRVRLEQAAKDGSRGAKAALALADAPTRFLSTVQVGITLIGIFAGAFGEASLAAVLGDWIERVWPVMKGHGRKASTVIVVLGIGYVSLVFGELVPKRLAMRRPEALASLVAIPMTWVALAVRPVVALLTVSTSLILRLMGIRDDEAHDPVTQEEVSALISKGTEAGIFEEAEGKIVSRVFDLADRRAVELMIPRNEIVWLDAAATSERIRVVIATESHSHFPVGRGGLDDLVGVVHVKDLVKNGLITERVDLAALARDPVFVPETTPALDLLDIFKAGGTHLAFVVDEHGALEGLVTLNDIVTEIVGEVARAGEPIEEEMSFRREDGSWLMDGRLGIEDAGRILGEDLDAPGVRTLGGFVMVRMGRIPRSGEKFTWHGHTFEVIDMDRQRVDKVLVTPRPSPDLPPDRP